MGSSQFVAVDVAHVDEKRVVQAFLDEWQAVLPHTVFDHVCEVLAQRRVADLGRKAEPH
jgi:hypothetical protein